MSVLLPECIIRIISGFHGVGFEEVTLFVLRLSGLRLSSSKPESLGNSSSMALQTILVFWRIDVIYCKTTVGTHEH